MKEFGFFRNADVIPFHFGQPKARLQGYFFHYCKLVHPVSRALKLVLLAPKNTRWS